MCILNTNVCMIRMSVIFFSRHAFCNTFSTHDLSWRSTVGWVGNSLSQDLFNSRPLVEVNQLHCEHYTDGIFSTHDLSWRSTTVLFHWRKQKFFQLTTSRGDRQNSKTRALGRCLFNSRPLVEIDDNASAENVQQIFSTHDLSWRSTGAVSQKEFDEFFQLTTSRGDRHYTGHYKSD